MAGKKDEKSVKSLAQYMLDKQRAACPVCKLPAAVRDQLGTPASDKGFTRRDQVEWLRDACGVVGITEQVLAKHFSARHDRGEE